MDAPGEARVPAELEAFLHLGPRERLKHAADPKNEAMLRSHLGDAAFEAYRGMSGAIDEGHLAADSAPNLIFAPGVMGSLLKSKMGGIWWLDVRTRKRLDSLRLQDDGTSDLKPEYGIESIAVDFSYEGFFAGALATDDFGYIDCHYDWRKRLDSTADRLAGHVAAARKNNGGRPVHIIAHSMGGLFVREGLRRNPGLWDHIGRIVFIGTPHFGSPAIAWYLKDHLSGFNMMALLGRYLSRDTFRSLWGVLTLLPAPQGVYPGTRNGDDHPCANFDMYDAAAWELEITDAQRDALQKVLDGVASFHRDLWHWHDGLKQTQRDRMAVIVGVGQKTLFRIAYKKALGFLWKKAKKDTKRVPGDPNRDGDGRVPVASAALDHVGQTRYVVAKHGEMACVPDVYEDAFRFLRDPESMQLPKDAEGALDGGHLAPSPAAATLAAAFEPASKGDDPGYLHFDPPDEAEVDALDEAAEAGSLPDFSHVRIL